MPKSSTPAPEVINKPEYDPKRLRWAVREVLHQRELDGPERGHFKHSVAAFALFELGFTLKQIGEVFNSAGIAEEYRIENIRARIDGHWALKLYCERTVNGLRAELAKVAG